MGICMLHDASLPAAALHHACRSSMDLIGIAQDPTSNTCSRELTTVDPSTFSAHAVHVRRPRKLFS